MFGPREGVGDGDYDARNEWARALLPARSPRCGRRPRAKRPAFAGRWSACADTVPEAHETKVGPQDLTRPNLMA